MKTSIKGIIDALEILVDYPRIEETVNIKEAQQFLMLLEKNGISEIPEADEKISSMAKSQKEILDEWRSALKKIRFCIPNNPSCKLSEDNLIDGCIYFIEYDDDGEEELADMPSGFFEFSNRNIANVSFQINGDDEFKGTTTGTWSEIFEILTNFSKKYFSVPEIPNT